MGFISPAGGEEAEVDQEDLGNPSNTPHASCKEWKLAMQQGLCQFPAKWESRRITIK